VVYPDSTQDVVKIVNVARKYRMPIIPYSGGTSLEGHFAGVRIPFTYSAMPPFSKHVIRPGSAVEGWGYMCRYVRNGQNHRYPWHVHPLQSAICAIDLIVSTFQKRIRTLSVSRA